ncbi:MAG: TRAP transporter small permease [Sphaerochaeta sp.]
MERFKVVLDSVFSWVLKLAMVLLVAMVVIVFTNVVLRYGFHSGVRWAEEMSLVIVIWFTFISMALGVKENLHINISLLPRKLGHNFFVALNVLKNGLQVFIGAVLLIYGWRLTLNGAKSRLPATHLPNSINYLVLPIVGVFIILYAGLYLIGDFKQFRGRRERI